MIKVCYHSVDTHQCLAQQCRGKSLYHWRMSSSLWSCARTLSSVMANGHETKGCWAKSVSEKRIGAADKTQLPYEPIAPTVCTIPMLFTACRCSQGCFNIRGKVLIMRFNITAINKMHSVRCVWDLVGDWWKTWTPFMPTNWISLSMIERGWDFHAPFINMLRRDREVLVQGFNRIRL